MFYLLCEAGAKKNQEDALYAIIKDALGGKWAPCEALIDDVWFVRAGYKYGSKKALFFCWLKGAASCIPGEPYITSTKVAM